MWDKPQLMQSIANMLIGISLLLIFYGAVHYVVHLPVFTLNAVRLSAEPQQVDMTQLRQVMHKELNGNFFTVDVDGVSKAFERLPWVRKASVRRYFPWQLEIELEEQVALARWNNTELVNGHGEIFAGKTEQPLPKFFGQAETSVEMMQMYKAIKVPLASIQQEVAQINLSERHAWQLHLKNGMVLELGRELVQSRLKRFLEVYPYSFASMQDKIKYVDLRYSNGFATSLPSGLRAMKGKG